MPVASKVATKKATAPAKKTGARRSPAGPKASENVNVSSASVATVDPVFVRDRAVQLALSLGIDSPTASKVITQAKRFEAYLLGNDTSAPTDEG